MKRDVWWQLSLAPIKGLAFIIALPLMGFLGLIYLVLVHIERMFKYLMEKYE